MLAAVLVTIFTAGIILNFIWEWIHFPLYKCRFSYGLIAQATLGDGAMTVGLYATTGVIVGNMSWLQSLSISSLGLFILLSVILAVVLEKAALAVRYWEYNDRMPVIPALNVGLSPVLQLAITPMLSVLTVRIALGGG